MQDFKKMVPVKKAKEVTGENLKEIAVLTFHNGEKLPRVSTYKMPTEYMSKQEAAQEIIKAAFGWAVDQWLRMDVQAVYAQEITNYGSGYIIGAWE